MRSLSRGVARIFKNGWANNHDYITIIMSKVLQWKNEFDENLLIVSLCDGIVNDNLFQFFIP